MTASSVDLNLTPVLQKYTDSLRSTTDDKLRYQQLLFLANKCPPMDAALKIPENKVPGCLSVVHVHATSKDGKIYFVGDSDAQLTKGLVALLVEGLSGHTAEDIRKVRPEFIQYAGIAASLTPGRNSGFLNMMKLMRDKAALLEQELLADKEDSVPKIRSTTPIYDAIMTKLSMLKPIELVVENESHKHAGHAGMNGVTSTESHFNVRIIASCFQGLSLVQRHKMIYTLLASEMNNGIHALSLSTKTPDE
jgi:sulfur transfer protein SufE/stress-induced morphogen